LLEEWLQLAAANALPIAIVRETLEKVMLAP
jgi:hypothetical protein